MPVVDIGDTSISYHVFGHGVPILFIPPPVVGAVVFYKQVMELSKDFQVILFELRGHHKSKKSDEALTYSVVARDIRNLLDALELKKVLLCGYSMGAQAGLEFARSYPEYVLGLVSVSGFSEASDVHLRSEIGAAIQMMNFHAKRTLSFALSLANADTVNILRSMHRTGCEADDFAIRTMFEDALCFNCTGDLSQLVVPMILIFGAWDVRLYRYARLFKEKLPQVEQIFLPRVSHQLPTRATERLHASIYDFARQVR